MFVCCRERRAGRGRQIWRRAAGMFVWPVWRTAVVPAFSVYDLAVLVPALSSTNSVNGALVVVGLLLLFLSRLYLLYVRCAFAAFVCALPSCVRLFTLHLPHLPPFICCHHCTLPAHYYCRCVAALSTRIAVAALPFTAVPARTLSFPFYRHALFLLYACLCAIYACVIVGSL